MNRTYSRDVTLLTLGQGMDLDADERERIRQHGIRVVHEPIISLDIEGGRITLLRTAHCGRRGAPVRGALLSPWLEASLRARARVGG
jgi:cytosine/adenosine deaminase-related metal-dependent hydrolase